MPMTSAYFRYLSLDVKQLFEYAQWDAAVDGDGTRYGKEVVLLRESEGVQRGTRGKHHVDVVPVGIVLRET